MRVRGGCGPPPLSILDKSRVSITPVNKQNQKPNSGTISLKLKIMKKMKKGEILQHATSRAYPKNHSSIFHV